MGQAAINKVKSIFRRKGKKVSKQQIKKKIEEMKLTNKPAKMPLVLAKPPKKAKYTQWKTKILGWDWRQFIKGFKYASECFSAK